MRKLLILSTHEYIQNWRSLSTKLSTIQAILNKGKNGDWTVEAKIITTTPTVTKKRIDSAWLKELVTPYYNDGADIVGFHFSLQQKKAWGIEPTLRGSNPRRADELGDFYFWSDESTRRKGYNQFIETCLHETSHEYYQQTKQIDLTHTYHDMNHDISGLFDTFDWSKFQPRRMQEKKILSLLQRKFDLLTQLLQKKETYKPNKLAPLVERAAANIVLEMKAKGHEVRIVQGFRSLEEQQKLYEQGRTTPGAIVTNAQAGESFHNYGVAVDFVFRKEGYNASSSLWELLGKVGEAQGFEWGGRWKGFVDKPHFEMKLGYSLKDFQKNKVDWSKFM